MQLMCDMVNHYIDYISILTQQIYTTSLPTFLYSTIIRSSQKF